MGARNMAEQRPQHEISIKNFSEAAERYENDFVPKYKSFVVACATARDTAASFRARAGSQDPELVVVTSVDEETYSSTGTAAHILRTNFGQTPSAFLEGMAVLNAAIQADIFSYGEDGFIGHVYMSPGPSETEERTCPWCAEQIKLAAVICRFCGRDVQPPSAETRERLPSMTLFRGKEDRGAGPPPTPPKSVPRSTPSSPPSATGNDTTGFANTDWSDIANVRVEWPESLLDAEADLKKWHEGIALYDNDDYPSMMRCATLLSASLAHSLYNEGILRGDDFPNTVFKVLYASLEAPPDGRTFAESAQRAARLVLTLIRENGWHPESMGGSGLFDKLIMDRGNFMLLTTATSPTGQPWDGGLKAFFAVPPQPVIAALPDPADAEGSEVVERMHNLLVGDNSGDPASEHHKNGWLLWASDDGEGALAAFAEAAKLGSVQAMNDAGDLAREMGRHDESRFWFESAANAGNAAAMWNMAVLAVNAGDLATAADWYQRSAEAGLADGYAALTQLASDRDDSAAERHWSRLGAEAGQTFCMSRHGLLLAMDAQGDVPMTRRAREFLEQAAHRGDVDAMGLAVSVNFQLGEEARGRRFMQMVLDTGDQEKIDILRRHGFL